MSQNYPTTVNRPDLQTKDGHPVGVQYPGGDFVDQTTGQIIQPSETHTKFAGSSGGSSSGGNTSSNNPSSNNPSNNNGGGNDSNNSGSGTDDSDGGGFFSSLADAIFNSCKCLFALKTVFTNSRHVQKQ